MNALRIRVIVGLVRTELTAFAAVATEDGQDPSATAVRSTNTALRVIYKSILREYNMIVFVMLQSN